MNKRMIFLILLILVVVGVLAYLYFFKEKPIQQQENIEQINLSINIVDKTFPDKNIRTGFKITAADGSFNYEGESSIGGGILVKIPSNHSYIINNLNLENQTYYTIQKPLDVYILENRQVRLDIIRAGRVTIISKSLFGGDENLTLKIRSFGFYQQPLFCLKWGLHVIRVSPLMNFTKFQEPQNYTNYDVCYSLEKSINNEEITLDFNYNTLGELDDKDFIKIVVIDRDLKGGAYITEDQGKDMGGGNPEFTFRFG